MTQGGTQGNIGKKCAAEAFAKPCFKTKDLFYEPHSFRFAYRLR